MSSDDTSFSIKDKLEFILENPEADMPIFFTFVERCNQILSHGMRLLKLYLSRRFKLNPEQKLNFSNDLIEICLKAVCLEDSFPESKEKLGLYKDVRAVYKSCYCPLLGKNYTAPSSTLLGGFFNRYGRNSIRAMYKNFIKQHYYKVFKTFIFALCGSKKQIHQVHQSNLSLEDQKIRYKEIDNKIFVYFNAVWKHDSSTPFPTYDEEDLFSQFPDVINQYPGDLDDEEINRYLKSMLIMTSFTAKRNLRLQGTFIKRYKIYNIFPLRTSKVLGHVTLDTCLIADNIIKDRHGLLINKSDYSKQIALCKPEIWGSLFRMNMLVFDQHGKYPHLISTDGYSCSILFKKDDHFKTLTYQQRRQHKDQWLARREPYKHLGYFPPNINILALPNQTDPIDPNLVISRMNKDQFKLEKASRDQEKAKLKAIKD